MSEKETAEEEALKNNTHVVAYKRVFGLIKFCGKCCGIWRGELVKYVYTPTYLLIVKIYAEIHMCVY
jgi:hypothetical protein